MAVFGSDVTGFGVAAAVRARLGQTTNDASSASGSSETPSPVAASDTASRDGAAPASEAPTGSTAVEAPQSARDTASTPPATAEASAPDPDDDISDIPAHLQPRAKQLIDQRRQAREEANAAVEANAAYEARIAELEAKQATATAEAAPNTFEAPIAVTEAQQVFEGAKAQFDGIKKQSHANRSAFMAELQKKIDAFELTEADAIAQLKQADANENASMTVYEAQLGRYEVEAEKAGIAEERRLITVRAALKPLIEANPDVPTPVIEMYANAGVDPTPAVKWFADQYAPKFEAKVKAATDTLKAAHAEAIKAKDAEIARLTKLAGNIAAAPSTAGGSANGNSTAPSSGTYTPPPGRFGYGQRIKDQIASMQRR